MSLKSLDPSIRRDDGKVINQRFPKGLPQKIARSITFLYDYYTRPISLSPPTLAGADDA